MLKKLFRKNSKSETDLKPNEDTCSAEYIQYTQELEQTLSVLEAHLHESDNPDEIILHALETACDFYNGDWAGFLEIDLELGLWTPYIWFNKNPDDKTTIMQAQTDRLSGSPQSQTLYRQKQYAANAGVCCSCHRK